MPSSGLLSNPRTTEMLRLALVVSVISTFVLAGCASSPRDTSGTASPQATSSADVRLAPAVAVPAASARNVVLTLTGPKEIVTSKDWGEFKREWRETFSEHAKQAGIAYGFVEDVPQGIAQEGTLLLVDVADYRTVGIGARIMLGVMTGNAFIDAKVRYLNLRDGSPFGERQYKTTSTAAAGIFAKVTPQQVDAIATNVFLDLKAAK